jgi:hypothetical protein
MSFPEVTVVYKNLSIGQINSLDQLYSGHRTKQYAYRICEIAIITIETINNKTLELSELPSEIIVEISEEIMKKSSISEEEYVSLKETVELYFAEILSGDSWKCDICKQKRLQGVRNCGFIGEKDKNPDFKLMVNNTLYTHCPIYDINIDVLNPAVDAYNIYNAKFLPDAGGWYDQTPFFTIASTLVHNQVEAQKKAQMDKTIQESRRKH